MRQSPTHMPWMRAEDLEKLYELAASIREMASQKEVKILCSRIENILDQITE